MSEYMTADEVAAQWRVEPGTVRAWARSHGLPHTRIGPRGQLRFRQADISAWLEGQQGPRPRRRSEPEQAADERQAELPLEQDSVLQLVLDTEEAAP